MQKGFSRVTNLLVENKIRPSHQRVKILEFLLESKRHPTAEEIYHALSTDIPTISKSTVYNTLNAFVDAKLIVPLTIKGAETRYDASTITHGHFKCDECGSIYDISLNNQPLEDKLCTEELYNFKVDTVNVYFTGTCSNCLQKKN